MNAVPTLEEAIARVNAVLADKKLWEDLAVVALELNDATDDMNDSLVRLEAAFTECRVRPAWVHATPGFLLWNGARLLYDSGKAQPVPLSTQSRAIRLRCCGLLQNLWEEALRERPNQ